MTDYTDGIFESVASLPVIFTNDKTFLIMEKFIGLEDKSSDAYVKFDSELCKFSSSVNGGFNNIYILRKASSAESLRESLSMLPSSHKEQLIRFIKDYYNENKDEIDAEIEKGRGIISWCVIM